MKNSTFPPSVQRQAVSRPTSVIDHPSEMRFVPSTPRERILFTALELIAEEGFRGFSLNRVIQRGGYSKGAVFHHFRNLDELCLACYDPVSYTHLDVYKRQVWPWPRKSVKAAGRIPLRC